MVYKIKYILLGDIDVGKSTIIEKYMNNRFLQIYIPTIGLTFYVNQMNKYDMYIWDSGGQIQFKNIIAYYYQHSQGIIFVYNVNNRNSFYNIINWYKHMKKHIKSNENEYCMILVGNKNDIKYKRQVSYNEGKLLARDYNMLFIETNCKNGNIDIIFNKLNKQILDKINKKEIIIKYESSINDTYTYTDYNNIFNYSEIFDGYNIL